MKFFDEAHLRRVASTPYPLFNNEMPPADGGTGSKMLAFIENLQGSLSLRETMKRVGCSLGAYEDFCNRSLWFCRSINAIAAHAQDEATWVQLSQALGTVRADENGNTLLDAEGKPVRSGVSDAAARMVVESRLRIASVGGMAQLAGAPDSFPPLLPSNINQHRQLQIDDCRMALDALRPAVRAGDRQAIDTFTKVQDRLAKLQGTDAPKTNVTYIGVDNVPRLSDAELEAVIRGNTLEQRPDGTYALPEEGD